MKTKLINVNSLCILIITIYSIVNGNCAIGQILFEDFESYSANSFPSMSWIPDANANSSSSYIDSTVTSEGNQSLKLFGTIGGCWGALAYHPISFNNTFTVEVDVRNGNEAINGCHPDRASLALRSGTSWTNPERNLLTFMGDGSIYGFYSKYLGSYSNEVWYKVKVKYEKIDTSVVLSYWIDNVFKGDTLLPLYSYENSLNNFQLSVDEGSSWFDNIIMYEEPNLLNGLVAYYPFNGNANDESGNGNHGIINGATFTNDRFGNSNSACSFDGNNDYIQIPNSNSFNITNQLSISYWVILKSSAPYSFPYHIIEKYGAWGSGQRVWDINFGIESTPTSVVWSTNNLSNTYLNYTMTYNGNVIKVYKDGALIDSTAYSGQIPISNYDIFIGKYTLSSSSYFFDGVVDDIRIYDRELSYVEVQAIYSQSNTLQNFNAMYSSSQPTIDGQVDNNEWSNANTYNITFSRNDGLDSISANLFLQHDNTWLYVGVQTIIDAGWDVYLQLRIDGNNDSTLSGFSSSPHTDIQIEHSSPGAWSGYSNYQYINGLSTIGVTPPSGTQWNSSNSNNVNYEYKILLSDLGINPGQSFGFFMLNGTDGTTEHNYEFPINGVREDATQWSKINITPQSQITMPWYYSITGTNHSIGIQNTIPITIDSVQISAGDYLGVFYDSLGTLACGGYLMWQDSTTVLAAWGEDIGNDGFVTGEVFKWKLWRASDGLEIEALAEYQMPPAMPNEAYFAPNGLSALASLSALTIHYQNVNLPFGWSIFSTFINPSNPSVDSVFSAITTSTTLVKDGLGQVYWPSFNINMIGNLITGQGYQVKMSLAENLEVTGAKVNPEQTPISIPSGWSIIGYLRQVPGNAITMMSPIVNDLVILKNGLGQVYWPSFGVNMIGNMIPGEGYQIKMSSSQILIYPPNTSTYSKSDINYEQPIYYKTTINTGSNMTLGIPINSWGTLPKYGDELGVFSQAGLLIGSGVFMGENMAVTIWGDDNITDLKEGLIYDEKFNLRLWSVETGKESEITVTTWLEGDDYYANDKISIVGELNFSQTEIAEEIILYQNQPNPFNDKTEFSFYLPKQSYVKLSILNLLGKEIELISNDVLSSGKHSVEFKTSNLPTGCYYYQIKTLNYTQTKKMIHVE